MRIRNQQLKLMRIHADPEPKPCIKNMETWFQVGYKLTKFQKYFKPILKLQRTVLRFLLLLPTDLPQHN